MTDEARLNALVGVYTKTLDEIQFYQKKGDDAPIAGMTLFVSLFGAQFFSEIVEINLTIINLISILVPIVIISGTHRGAEAHKFLAVLRGYAAFLEDEINTLMGNNTFLFNSEYIDRYFRSDTITKKSKFKVNWMVIYVSNIFPLLTCTFVFWFNNKTNFALIIPVMVYFVLCIFAACFFAHKFVKKENDRIGARLYPHIMHDSQNEKSLILTKLQEIEDEIHSLKDGFR